MENYNQLIKEFHDSDTQSHSLIHLKALADELFTNRTNKKMQYLVKKRQLADIPQQKNQSFARSRLSVTLRSNVTSLTLSKEEMVSIDKSELKKKISQLEQEIDLLRERTQQINNELDLFNKQQEEVEVMHKRNELEVFNSIQELYIQAAKQNEQQLKQQQMLSQLRHRREKMSNEVQTLIKQKQSKEEIIKKWNKIKNIKVPSVKLKGMQPQAFKQMLFTLLKIKQMLPQNDKMTNIPQVITALQATSHKIDMIALLKQHQVNLDKSFTDHAIEYYHYIENEFDRNERANKQINSYLQSLNVKNDELADILEKAQLHKQKRTQQTLKQTAFSLKELEETFNKKCSTITSFTTKCYLLLKRMMNLKKTISQITSNSSMICDEEENEVIKNYEENLNKNPEDFLVRWTESIGPSSTFYQTYIQSNDLLRLLSCPESFNSRVDDLTNYQMFLTSSFRYAYDLTKQMSKQIKKYFTDCCFSGNAGNNASGAEVKQFCVESMDYYRRDNYKLLEKLKKHELRKKGLLAEIPFNVGIQNQLLPCMEKKEEKRLANFLTPRETEINRKYMKYTDLASKREERSFKTRSSRRMFNQLISLRSRSCSRFVTLSSLKESRIGPALPNEWRKRSMKRIAQPRNTVSTLHK